MYEKIVNEIMHVHNMNNIAISKSKKLYPRGHEFRDYYYYKLSLPSPWPWTKKKFLKQYM